jgi:hypothetical protein
LLAVVLLPPLLTTYTLPEPVTVKLPVELELVKVTEPELDTVALPEVVATSPAKDWVVRPLLLAVLYIFPEVETKETEGAFTAGVVSPELITPEPAAVMLALVPA